MWLRQSLLTSHVRCTDNLAALIAAPRSRSDVTGQVAPVLLSQALGGGEHDLGRSAGLGELRAHGLGGCSWRASTATRRT